MKEYAGRERGKNIKKSFEKGVDKTAKFVYYMFRRLREVTTGDEKTGV